jgi:hypothetical protein
MKNLSLFIIFIFLSSCNFGRTTYICDVLELANISPENEENFGVKNGSSKGTENEYQIKISVNEKKLDFKNLGNGTKMSMERDSYGEDKSKMYANGGYGFELYDDGRFTFIVNKANYHADYLGTCEKIK